MNFGIIASLIEGGIKIAEDIFGPKSGDSKKAFVAKVATDAATTVAAATGNQLPASMGADIEALIEASVKVQQDLGLLGGLRAAPPVAAGGAQ